MLRVGNGPKESMNQFALPHGFGGRVVGLLMAVLNTDMERRAVKILSLSGGESVLEVGFGPGVGIRLLAKRLPRGFVAGIDPSEVMIAQAARRNRPAIEAGRVELRAGTASSLPFDVDRFDAAVSVNNIQEWPSLRRDLGEVWRVLKPNGQLAVAVHAWVDKHAKDRGDPDRPWQHHIVDAIGAAGFAEVSSKRSRALSGSALYFTALKRPSAGRGSDT
jgi:ubiquinone/menaquinone biosynthesis C-methylase UbiE